MSSLETPLRYGLDQAARLLNVSRSVIYCRVKAGELSVHRDGKRVYVLAEELARYAAAKAGSQVHRAS